MLAPPTSPTGHKKQKKKKKLSEALQWSVALQAYRVCVYRFELLTSAKKTDANSYINLMGHSRGTQSGFQ